MSALGFVNILSIDSEGEGQLDTVRYDLFVQQLFKADTRDQMINHAALGVCGEAGELADCIKRNVHYRKPLDRENLIEELGDLRFYVQAVMNLFGVTEQEVLQANADKLCKRYVELRYTDSAAIARADKQPQNHDTYKPGLTE